MPSQWSLIDPGYSRIQGVCPYVDWALGSGEASFFPNQDRRVPVILRLNRISPREFASGDSFISDTKLRALWRHRVRIPAIYTQPEWRKRPRIVCTASVTRWFFHVLDEHENIRSLVIRITLGLPLRGDSLPPFRDDDGETAR